MNQKRPRPKLIPLLALLLTLPAFAQDCPRSAIIQRDAQGKIIRDPAAKRAFRQTHPCPATGETKGACPGYVIDHIVPLKRGGADMPCNMAWQTVEEAKAKDRWE